MLQVAQKGHCYRTFFETSAALNSKWFTACRTLASRLVPSMTGLDAYISHHKLNVLLL